MLDNISSNDTCVREILKIQPSLNPEKRRLCCFGHIINLITKAFLFGKDPDTFKAEANSFIHFWQEEKELEAWRKLGPIGKLHNVVFYIQKRPQRREAFLNIVNNESATDAEGKIKTTYTNKRS